MILRLFASLVGSLTATAFLLIVIIPLAGIIFGPTYAIVTLLVSQNVNIEILTSGKIVIQSLQFSLLH